MPDSLKNNGWGIYAVRKVIEYAGIGLALWQLGIPALNNYIEERIKAYEQEHKSSKSFRELLSDETKIPSDRIHIEFGKWYNDHVKVEGLVNRIAPHLEEEIANVQPRLTINPVTGRAKWLNIDGEIYDATIGQDGFYWFYHPHKGWTPCKV